MANVSVHIKNVKILRLIETNKIVLFHENDTQKQISIWNEIYQSAVKLGVAPPNLGYQFMRDVFWEKCKSKSMDKVVLTKQGLKRNSNLDIYDKIILINILELKIEQESQNKQPSITFIPVNKTVEHTKPVPEPRNLPIKRTNSDCQTSTLKNIATDAIDIENPIHCHKIRKINSKTDIKDIGEYEPSSSNDLKISEFPKLCKYLENIQNECKSNSSNDLRISKYPKICENLENIQEECKPSSSNDLKKNEYPNIYENLQNIQKLIPTQKEEYCNGRCSTKNKDMLVIKRELLEVKKQILQTEKLLVQVITRNRNEPNDNTDVDEKEITNTIENKQEMVSSKKAIRKKKRR